MARAKKTKELRAMTPAEQICKNAAPDIKAQAVTLAEAVLTMQKKIEQQIPNYEKMPLAQQVTVGTGEKMLRVNPEIQEFRATVRDYAQLLSSLSDILESEKAPKETSSVEELRSRFKVV